jgi:putative oxidoreductase
MKAFFQTDENINNLIIRVMLGIVVFPHGAQKLLGWFGGYGLEGTLGFFTDKLGVPLIIAILVILGESLGALGLIAGFMTRFCAIGVLMIMAGAVVMSHAANGFFMNWSGQQAGEGFEYHILAIALCIPLLISGGGRFSADGFISKRFLTFIK